jgi:hypothetical protein
LEGKDSEVESKRSVKLAVQEENEEEQPEELRSSGASAVVRENPYVRNIQKKGDEDRKASGKEDEFVALTKDNTTKAKGGKVKEHRSAGVKGEMDSGDELVEMIPQSNIKPNLIQSPRKVLRQVVEGLKLPIF